MSALVGLSYALGARGKKIVCVGLCRWSLRWFVLGVGAQQESQRVRV